MSRPEFFDCNTQIGVTGRPGPGGFSTVDGLIRRMDAVGIAEAIVHHVAAVGRSAGNHRMLEEIAGEARLRGCWVLPPHHEIDFLDAEALVGEMLAHGVHVARTEPPYYHADVLADWACGGLLAALESHRVPLLLGGTRLGRHPDDTRSAFSAQGVYDICQRHPDLPVVILHLNWSATRLVVPLLRTCPNLHVEISYYSAHRGLEFLAQRFGSERILFGTGVPTTGPGAPLALVTYAALADEERQLIAGGSIRRLLAGVRG